MTCGCRLGFWGCGLGLDTSLVALLTSLYYVMLHCIALYYIKLLQWANVLSIPYYTIKISMRVVRLIYRTKPEKK